MPVPNFVLYVTGETTIPLLAGVVDGYPDEKHTINVRKTEFPIETGATLTDHAVRAPTRLEFSGWTSDLSDPITGERPSNAWERIVSIADARTRVEVQTPIGRYSNMLITKAETNRSVSTGKSLQFTLTMDEILIVGEEGSPALTPAQVSGPARLRTGGTNLGTVQGLPTTLADGIMERLQTLERAVSGGVGNPQQVLDQARSVIGGLEDYPRELVQQVITQSDSNRLGNAVRLAKGERIFR